MKYRSYRNHGRRIDMHDLYEKVYQNLPKQNHVLHKVAPCPYYNAKHFPGEGKSFCCMKGKVKIHIPDISDELRRLYTSQTDEDAKYFRKHIRYFNLHFLFTSFGVKLDRRYSTFCLLYTSPSPRD